MFGGVCAYELSSRSQSALGNKEGRDSQRKSGMCHHYEEIVKVHGHCLVQTRVN